MLIGGATLYPEIRYSNNPCEPPYLLILKQLTHILLAFSYYFITCHQIPLAFAAIMRINNR